MLFSGDGEKPELRFGGYTPYRTFRVGGKSNSRLLRRFLTYVRLIKILLLNQIFFHRIVIQGVSQPGAIRHKKTAIFKRKVLIN